MEYGIWNGMELSMRAPNRVTISIITIIIIIAFNILEMVTVQSWRARSLKFLKFLSRLNPTYP